MLTARVNKTVHVQKYFLKRALLSVFLINKGDICIRHRIPLKTDYG